MILLTHGGEIALVLHTAHNTVAVYNNGFNFVGLRIYHVYMFWVVVLVWSTIILCPVGTRYPEAIPPTRKQKNATGSTTSRKSRQGVLTTEVKEMIDAVIFFFFRREAVAAGSGVHIFPILFVSFFSVWVSTDPSFL